jgi:ribosomal-protein-alanine N-acetyltransferase
MSTAMPPLQTERLIIRPFVMDDLDVAHRVLSAAWDEPPETLAERRPARERWLQWNVANYDGLVSVDQPPYGDRAVVLRENGQVIGSAGLVPAIGPFGQLPGYPADEGSRFWYPEVGLFWAVDPAHQGRGYATEAGRALIDFAFSEFHLGRIVATTEYTNERSMAVMRKLGMRILRNPLPHPEWFQAVGLLENA